MYTATRNVVLPTTITGSLPRPGWHTENLKSRPFRVAMADKNFREQYQDAVSCLIRDQERAGLDIVTDGDARFDTDVGGRSWVSYVVQRLQGFSGYETSRSHAAWGGSVPGEIMYEVLEARVLPKVTGPIGPGPLEYAALWRTAQQMTARPVKFGSISGDCLESIVSNDHYRDRRQLVRDICEVMHGEFTRLAAAGCRVFQVEEPWVHRFEHHQEDRAMSREFYVEAFNRSVKGLRDRLELWCHTCWGNPAQQRFYDSGKSYAPALEAMNALDVDVLTFESASSDGMDFEAIGRTITRPKIAIGVITHRSLQVERPDEVAALIRKALRYIPVERLCQHASVRSPPTAALTTQPLIPPDAGRVKRGSVLDKTGARGPDGGPGSRRATGGRVSEVRRGDDGRQVLLRVRCAAGVEDQLPEVPGQDRGRSEILCSVRGQGLGVGSAPVPHRPRPASRACHSSVRSQRW